MSGQLKAFMVAQELDAIPTPVGVAARMLELAMDRESTPQQYAEVIAADPGLAARFDLLTPETTGTFETWDGQPVPF